MSVILKNNILKELNAINWSQEDGTVNSDKAFEAIITGIYNYINENYTITGLYTGTHLTTPTPTPIFGTSTHNLSIKNTSWLNTFKNIIRSGVSENGIQRIFTAIQTMLVGTVLATLETASTFTTTLPTMGTPVVPVVFPSITSFGTPCQLEIMGTKPKTKEDAWGIISRYIQQSLNINVIPPITFSGIIVSPATAITTSTLVFL